MGNLLDPFGAISACTTCQTDPNCDYEDGRRQIAKYMQHLLRSSDDVRIIEKYIEVPSGHILFTKCYIPLKKQPKACIFSHFGWANSIDRPDTHNHCLTLAENGYIVITHDHLGYGRSDGLWLYIPNTFDIDYVDNAHFIHDYCKNLYIRNETSHKKQKRAESYDFHDPSIFLNYFGPGDDEKSNDNNVMPWSDLSYIDEENKYFLCGRSMGGAVATRVAMKYPSDYRGLALICPMIEIDAAVKPSNFITWIFKKLAHWFPTRRWSPSNDIHDHMVSTESGRNKIWTQGMMNKRPAPLKTAYEMLMITETIQNNMELLKMDFIVLHGLEDKVTSCSVSQKMYDRRKDACDATIKLYANSAHMIWWEPCGEQMFKDMIGWFDGKSQ